jgi:hypothetical protein
MKLELKHLAPYLPYGLKIKTKHGFDTMETLNGWLVNGDHEESYCYEDHPNETLEFKPILRPLSDLTEEHANNCNYSYRDFKWEIINKNVSVNIWNDLLSNHYDVFGLIDAGLAIDINTL